jgi:hypothetical protein
LILVQCKDKNRIQRPIAKGFADLYGFAAARAV